MASSSKASSIDTCILLRIIINDDAMKRDQAKELLLSGQNFYVDQAVISECVYVLKRIGCTRQEIVDNLRTLLHNDFFIYDREFYDSVFAEYLKHPSLSFDDCLISARATSLGFVPLWTFDKKLAHQSDSAKLL